MKIALAQLNYHIGNFEENEAKIIAAITNAKANKADLVVFAELAICGYPPRDFLDFEDFITQCENSINRIAKHCFEIDCIVGGPSRNAINAGKKLFNTAFYLSNGQVKKEIHKQLLPTYDVFDEYRYFEPGEISSCINIKGSTIAVTICEDLWNIEGKTVYKNTPMDHLIQENPALIINIAASPFSYQQEQHRKKVFDFNYEKYGLPIVYVNHVGAQTELIFDGHSNLYSGPSSQSMLKAFEEDFQIITLGEVQTVKETKLSKYEKIESALVLGIKDYFRKLGFKRATLGLSGGIDSALSLVLAVKALGAENVFPILMPSQFSSEHSITDSIELCHNLGCKFHQIEIKDIFNHFEGKLEPLFHHTSFDLTEENIQSRIRGTLLMAYCNKFGSILLNTSNKSELAVGYGTLYGDMSGGLSLIGDLYKTEVFELSKHLNSKKEIIPTNIIEKPPSAELRPNQKDSDSLPDYELLDQVLYLYIEKNQSPQNIISQGFDKELVDKTLKMVNINEYKRYQAPPILRVSDKAFGMGRRMPIVGKYLS